MKTRIVRLCAGLIVLASFAAAAATDAPSVVNGTWSLNNWTPGSSVRLKMKHASGRSTWEWGTDQPLSDLDGLTREQLRAASAQVTFKLQRDAGTFTFRGSVMLGLGHGEFRFAPDPTFALKLNALGHGTIPGKDLFAMAIRDISLDYASAVMRSGIKGATVGDLGRFRDHGVETDFMRTLKAAGYDDLTAADVVKLADHGVDSAYIEGLADSGRTALTADEIVRLRDHGVDPGYVARVESAGFTGLTVDQIIRLREHGID